ncbi:hypothetical protein LWI29_035111 [Acer saccharum]|uniref:Rx N-terminal domain-containing protein n=1 Tax=Acer saccharum TaxID=4024 RepID=A0AA39RJP2_ACESA|nr:hypothetical protein LWI29_035111 [Acer saccharum]
MVFFVVEALVSASLQVLLDRASPRTNLIKFFQRHKFDEIHFKNLETTLLQVNAVLSDAEEKQITNLSVRQWIDELKDAAYHTVDLLDEIHSNSQESNSSDLGKTVKKHKSKLEKMSNKLENIAKHKDVLGLEASFSGKISPRLQQTSLVDETEGTSALKMMPPKFGMLESLRILTTFVVSLGGSSIKELGRLSHLGGKLSILELQNVEDPKDAEDADLKNKKNINELEFSWSSTGRANVGDPKDAEDADLKNKKNIKEPEFSWSSTGHADEELGITWSSTGLADKERSQTTILEKLHPHENIEKLSIRGFRGTELPNWLGDSKFSNMVFLHLSDCRNCSSLPSLRQLSSLQKLRVMNCDCLMKFAINFSSHLKSLEIHDCGNLRILKISDNLHQDLKFFKKLEISKCPSLEMFRLPAPKLTDFSVSSCNNLRSMPKQMCQLLTSLQTLNISDCPRLVSFPNGGLPLSLQTLTIQNCVKLQSMPEQMHILPALQTLDISDCPELVPFPEGGLPSSLQKLTIQNCVKLRSMPEQVHMLLSSLQTLNITGCPELVSFPDGGLPPSLQTLTIKNCVNLISPPQNAWGLTNMESLTCLTIECAHANVNSFPDKGLLPASLTCLQIIGFPGLITLNLSGLQHLTLLKSLEIHSCNRLQILSDDGRLPSSLSSLAITGCSLQLKDQCQKDGGRYWDKISHIETRSITATI